MKLADIREEVKLIVNDPDFEDDVVVDGYINQALLDAASQLTLTGLKGVDTVTTSTTLAYVSVAALDGGFSGKLRRVYNSTGESVEIYPSLESLMDNFGMLDEAGEVEAVCLEGNTLWYAMLPSAAETLTLLYYKPITTLVADSDVPSYLPEFSHRDILVHGACAMMFDVFEDGVDGVKINASSHRGLAALGIVKAREWFGRSRPHDITSIWSC